MKKAKKGKVCKELFTVYSDQEQEGHQLTSGNAAPGVTTLTTLCSLPSAGMAMAMKMAMAGNVQSQLPAGSQ